MYVSWLKNSWDPPARRGGGAAAGAVKEPWAPDCGSPQANSGSETLATRSNSHLVTKPITAETTPRWPQIPPP